MSDRLSLTQKRLAEVIRIDPIDGVIYWIGREQKKGGNCIAGLVDRHGYRQICVDGYSYRGHRLVWLYVFGTFPSLELDHIDGQKDNNRIGNLREVTRTVNMQNVCHASATNTTGLMGAHRNSGRISKPWKANIKVNGKGIHLGVYATAEEASAAYLAAKIAMHDCPGLKLATPAQAGEGAA